MKILSQSKKGTKILLENHEAMMTFTKEGVRTSLPHAIVGLVGGEGASTDEEEEVLAKEATKWMDKNNPSIYAFFTALDALTKDKPTKDDWNKGKYKYFNIARN